MRQRYCLAVRSCVLVALLFLSACSTSTYFGRWMRWRQSDVEDYKRFPSHDVENAPPTFHFTAGTTPPSLDTIEYRHGDARRVAALNPLLKSTGTTALIVVRNDTLLYEGYFNGYDRSSINTSFSVAKSVTSMLVGIAIDEGHIGSVHDPITTYLPELKRRDTRFEQITIEHLLSMKSGLAFRDHGLPWGDKPKAYYGPNLRERVMHLDIAEEPGETFVYNTYNPILLGVILERATEQPVSEYFEAKLWKPLGMEFGASWSIDSEEGQMVKMESGINARAIDFAKLGRLFLKRGRWQGASVISEEWVATSMEVDEANRVPHIGGTIHYQYAWWVHAPTEDQRYAVGAWGHLGQYIYIFPKEEIVIVRFGKKTGDVSWPRLVQEIVGACIQADESERARSST